MYLSLFLPQKLRNRYSIVSLCISLYLYRVLYLYVSVLYLYVEVVKPLILYLSEIQKRVSIGQRRRHETAKEKGNSTFFFLVCISQRYSVSLRATFVENAKCQLSRLTMRSCCKRLIATMPQDSMLRLRYT